MAVDIAELIPALRAALNVPGAARPMFDFDTEDPWIEALAAAFWTVQSRGRKTSLWVNYRVTTEEEGGDQIVNVVDVATDLERIDQQLIVLQAAYTAISTLLISLPTKTVAKAGPVESDTERSSTVLRQLLLDKKEELKDALAQVGAGVVTGAIPRVIDSMLTRSGYSADVPHFVN